MCHEHIHHHLVGTGGGLAGSAEGAVWCRWRRRGVLWQQQRGFQGEGLRGLQEEVLRGMLEEVLRGMLLHAVATGAPGAAAPGAAA